MKHFHNFLIQVIVIFALVSGTALAQDKEIPVESLNAAFETYRCEFIAETNQVRISATLVGANGLPIPISDVSLSITSTDENTGVLREDINLVALTQRPPSR